MAASAAPAFADPAVERIDAERVLLRWDTAPSAIRISADPSLDPSDPAASVELRTAASAIVRAPAAHRSYFLLRDKPGASNVTVVAERVLPLERGSNFRDIGGYAAAGGKHVAWGRIYRSGALPMLSEADYTYLGGLGLTAIVDLRSTDERAVAPDLLDDRTGALFVSNDYPIGPLIAAFRERGGGPLYAGIEKRLVPQLHSLFKLLLRDDGAVMFHCSAGQDRTGVAAALILSALGVDRETIVRDYHLSTPSRRPQYEMPAVDPQQFPGNLIIQIYAAQRAKHGEPIAEPLYTADGQSHMRMFLDYLDRTYGGPEGYLRTELGIGPAEIARLRAMYLV
jgi:protein-tyrosine phosphatase